MYFGIGGIEPDHTLVKQELEKIIPACMPSEREHLASTLHEKIWNYLWKAKKGLNFEGTPWKELVKEFSDKFYSSLWMLGGDRKWIEEVDFTHLVGVAVQSYFPGNVNADIDPITFANSLQSIPEAANDYSRFHWHAPEIVKKHVPTKAKSKIVYRCLDEAREETVNQGILDALTFVRSWLTLTVKKINAEPGHPQQNLPKTQAVALFDEFVCGVGVPSAIMKLVDEKPMPGNQVVIDAVNEAYQPYGEPPKPKPQMTGGGYGPAKGGGWGAQPQGGFMGQAGAGGFGGCGAGMGGGGGGCDAIGLLQGLAAMGAQGKGGGGGCGGYDGGGCGGYGGGGCGGYGGGGCGGGCDGKGAMLMGALMQMMKGGGSGSQPY